MLTFRSCHGVILFLALALAWSTPAAAQSGTPAGTAPAAPAGGGAVSPEQADALIATLEDPAARARLIEQIRLLARAQQGAEPESPAATPVEAVGTRALSALSEQISALGGQIAALGFALSDLPQVTQWAWHQATDPAARAVWVPAVGQVGLVLALAVACWLLMRLILRRLRRRLARDRRPRLITRLPAWLGHTLLDLAPTVAFTAAGIGTLGLVDPGRMARIVTLAAINAGLIIGIVLVLARAVLAPRTPALRLYKLDDETASYLYVWITRITGTVVAGHFLADAGYRLGLSRAAHDGLLALVGLLVVGMVAVFVLQNRAAVAGTIRVRAPRSQPWSTIARSLAEIWHVLTIAYIVAVYVIWVLAIPNGFAFMLRATGLSVLIILSSILAGIAAGQLIARGFAVAGDLRASFPGLEARANRYLPIFHTLVKALITVIAVAALLDVWGVEAFEWLTTGFGRTLSIRVLSILFILAVALLVWELFRGVVERLLNRTDEFGRPMLPSARVRTLLPLLRNAVLVVLVIMVTLILLAELGFNIAPLLAGAGVIGLAIGFGSQSLVKDVITGLFILFEDTISIGDVVNVAGRGGLVEGMTIRTIRLRDFDGSVHTVPFSEVTTILNMTKDFSYYVFDIGVAYREDIDRCYEAIRAVGAEMQADPAFSADILAPIEIHGVDQLGDNAVVIKARIKTKPIRQWAVGRDFNRRLKKHFDALGIEIPFPHRTIYFGQDQQGNAPAAHVAVAAPALAEAIAAAGGHASAARAAPPAEAHALSSSPGASLPGAAPAGPSLDKPAVAAPTPASPVPPVSPDSPPSSEPTGESGNGR